MDKNPESKNEDNPQTARLIASLYAAGFSAELIDKVLDSSLSLRRAGAVAGNDDMIVLENWPATKLLASKPLDELDDTELVRTVSKLSSHSLPYALCLLSSDVEKGIIDQHKYLLFEPNTFSKEEIVAFELSPFTQAAGRYGITRQQSGESPGDVYARLLQSMRDFKEHPGAYFYEQYPKDPVSAQDAVLHVAVQLIADKASDTLFH